MDVELYVYDLSRGLARQMSRNFLGTYIDAVYHTALVFGGVEYFFGAGIQTCYPGSTHHGRPMEIIPMGKTQLDLPTILEYLESMKAIFTVESYDLFLHNCNNFTHDFAMFLLGKGIPDHITSLPQTVLNTPFGQMLKPQLDSAMRNITQAPVPPSSVPPQPKAISIKQSPSRRPASYPQQGIVHNITKQAELDSLLLAAKTSCAVVFFTSVTCPPCKICYAPYDALAAEFSHKTTLIKVDISVAHEIARNANIRATPTFVSYLQGEKLDEWLGADPAKLTGNVRMLVQMAFPPHPHGQLNLPKLRRIHEKPVLYAKLPPLEKLVAKLGNVGATPEVRTLKEFVETRSKGEAASAAVPDLPAIGRFVVKALNTVPPNDVFPLIDLLRLAVVDARVSGYFAEEEISKSTIFSILSHVNELGDECPYSLRIVSVQTACNLFSSPLYPPKLLGDASLSSALSQLVASALLDEDHAPVRVCAASLAFNIAAVNHKRRLHDEDNLLSEGMQVELVASLLEAIGRESSTDGLKGLVLALGLLAYGCPVNGELRELLSALSAVETVKSKAPLMTGEKSLVDEVLAVVA